MPREMNRLDTILKQLAARPMPELHWNLEAAVWQEIRRRRRSFSESLLARIASCIWQWRCAAVAVVAALLFGGSLAALHHETSEERFVTQAVHLEIFSEHSPTLLLNSLYERF